MLIGTCSAFFVIVTDLAPVLVTHLLGTSVPPEKLRMVVPVLLAIFIVLPVCLLKNLSSLVAISIVSLLFYLSLAVQLLYMAVGTLSQGKISDVKIWQIEGAFTSLPIFSLAFCCQL